MPEGCENPVWPCAMAGAAACLSGFHDLGVILHGSSGCYYYTQSLVQAPLHCTTLACEDVIFGAEERLRALVAELAGSYARIAVIPMCVPSIVGEDLAPLLEDYNVLIVDTPGFTGRMEEGYRRAMEVIAPSVDESRAGVNIDGIALTDRFARGNRREGERLLRMAGIPVATCFCSGRLEDTYRAAPVTVEANPDLRSGVGTSAGSLLGLENLRTTFHNLQSHCSGSDSDRVFCEIDETEESVVRSCDRYLRRNNPPRAAIFATAAYAEMIAGLLATYLDAEIAVVGTRNPPSLCSIPAREAYDLGTIGDLIRESEPDLLIGSSYEHVTAPRIRFVGLTYPLRGQYMLQNRAVAGTEGVLSVIEAVLNACTPGNAQRI
ncbi:MAG: oxidoreductase [Methanomicrobiaceae archaeon]|nr:oxidoreductase [Methanomicrobiaceae archaeon]